MYCTSNGRISLRTTASKDPIDVWKHVEIEALQIMLGPTIIRPRLRGLTAHHLIYITAYRTRHASAVTTTPSSTKALTSILIANRGEIAL